VEKWTSMRLAEGKSDKITSKQVCNLCFFRAVDPEDVELFARAKKLQSAAKNLQTLQVLCMKTAIKHFDHLSTSLEYLGNFNIY